MLMGREETRGVSNVLGVALLTGVIVVGLTVLGIAGYGLFTDEQARVQTETVENDVEAVATELEAIAFEPRATSEVALSLHKFQNGASLRVEPDHGHIEVTEIDGSGTRSTLVDTNLGGLIYEDESNEVVYENGAVFSHPAGETAYQSTAPSISAAARGSTTVNFPLFIIRDAGSSGDVEQISRRADLDRVSQTDAYPQLYVPPSHSIEIEISTNYPDSWSRYLEETLPASVSTIRTGGSTVTVTLGSGSSTGIYLHMMMHTIEVSGS